MNLWACEENFLRSYLERVYNTTADQEKIEAFFLLTEDEKEDDPIYSIDGDKATINIRGVLTQHGLPPIAKFFGFVGTSYIEILEAIEAVNVDGVKSIDLIMDTPGGEVAGVDETAQAVKALAAAKDVTAINESMIASAGYWIASQASRIEAAAPTVETGSIGVVIAGVDTTEAEKARGVKRVTIVSKNAPNKRADVTDKKGIAELQRRIDAIERVFISRVAAGRGVSEDTVRKTFGRGGVLIAYDPDDTAPSALSVGMIDSVENAVFTGAGSIQGVREIEASEIDPVAGATPFKDLPVVDRPWDSTAADKRLRDFTNSKEKPSRRYKEGFFWYDSANSENFGAYKLPFADVVDGKLVAIRRGVMAANGAMSGARGGVDIPEKDRSAVQKHIDRYRDKIAKEDEQREKESNAMSIEKLINDNPDLAAHIDAEKSAAFDSGKNSTIKRIETAAPILESNAYPDSIRAIACQVLKGEQDPAALTGAVAAYDAIKEEGKNKEAIEEQAPDTPAQVEAAPSNDGVIRSKEDYDNSIKRIRAARGLD